MNDFDHLLTPSPPLQNDNCSQHFYQLSEVSGGPIGYFSQFIILIRLWEDSNPGPVIISQATKPLY